MSARFRPIVSALPKVYGPFRNNAERRATQKAVQVAR